MPIFDFICRACEHEFVFNKFKSTDEPPNECPECLSDKIEKQLSRGTSIRFKGKGFYVTDYKKKDKE